MSQLTRELGSEWLTSRISMKRYACHSTGHTPVQAIIDLKRDEGLTAEDVEEVTVMVGEKELSRHDIRDPKDIMIGQYSVPFCVAVALAGDANDPRTFRDADVNDPQLRALIERIRLVPWGPSERPSPIATITTVKTRDGRELKAEVHDFKGTPDNPLGPQELREKFLTLTRDHDEAAMAELFTRVQNIEAQSSLDWISV
jgi:2-methylcitrate dehydratase PrpD